MTRRDFEFLARVWYLMLNTGAVNKTTFGVFCAEMEKNYSNFNRNAFEKKAVPKRMQ